MPENDMPPPIWHRRWFQQLLALLLILVIATIVAPRLLAALYAVRTVLVPVLIALGLAYIVHPLLTWAQHRLRLPRLAGTFIILLFVLLVGIFGTLLIVPPLINQGATLIDKARDVYPRLIALHLDQHQDQVEDERPQQNDDERVETVEPVELPAWLDNEQTRELIRQFSEQLAALDGPTVANFLVSSMDVGVGLVGSAISFTTYLLIAAVVIAFCFVFFSWKMDRMAAWFVPFIPIDHRTQTLAILGKMDQTVAAFIRGRLIQAMIVALVLSVGWWLCDVRYWLLLGLIGGVLNLIPFAAVAVWPVAVLLAWLDALAGGQVSIWAVVVWPSLVYFIAQGLDGWVVEPLVQGQATELDPLTVLLVVLLGAAVAGLLGMLLAIPIAACVRILGKEIVLPKLRAWAATGSASS